MIQTATDKGFTLFCLTEHIPRLKLSHLYPEEIDSRTTIANLKQVFESYYVKAREMQKQSKIKLLVGFESECLDAPTLSFIDELKQKHDFDMFIGSLHHVKEIPIDYNQETWQEACDLCGGREALFASYFDEQYEMLQRLRPTVIGHFDLIRLFSPDHSISAANWVKVERNVKLGIEMGCLFEINTSAIRKGWKTPYPEPDIADLIHEMGGTFCLSDDSHKAEQVGLNYDKIGDYFKYRIVGLNGEKLEKEKFDKWLVSDMSRND